LSKTPADPGQVRGRARPALSPLADLRNCCRRAPSPSV
jgi:hypothetical protein